MNENSLMFNIWKGVPGTEFIQSGEYGPAPVAQAKPAAKPVAAAAAPKSSPLTSATVPSHFDGGYSKIEAEGWLTITSPIFKDETKFPVFKTQDGLVDILTSPEYTRINEKFHDEPVDKNPAAKAAPKDPNSPPGRSFFYFRLNNQMLYFAESKVCMNILGSIDYRNQVEPTSVHFVDDKCFLMIEKSSGTNFKYCAQNNEDAKKFLCKIQTNLRTEPDEYCQGKVPVLPGNTQPPKVTPGALVETVITQPYILIPLAREMCNENWNYGQHGRDWKCLCNEGKYYYYIFL